MLFALSLRTSPAREHLAVWLKRQTVLSRPLIEQRWIVPELQKRRGDLFRLWYVFVCEIETRLIPCAFGIGRISDASDVSVPHTKSSCAGVQRVTVFGFSRAGEGSDATKI